jgi:hypothetical protein
MIDVERKSYRVSNREKNSETLIKIKLGKVSPYTELDAERGLNTKRPTIVFFLGLTKPLPSCDYASPHRRYSVC